MLYQVTCRETVYVNRVYEIEAESPSLAAQIIGRSQGMQGELIDEDITDSMEFLGVAQVCDEDGNDCKFK